MTYNKQQKQDYGQQTGVYTPEQQSSGFFDTSGLTGGGSSVGSAADTQTFGAPAQPLFGYNRQVDAELARRKSGLYGAAAGQQGVESLGAEGLGQAVGGAQHGTQATQNASAAGAEAGEGAPAASAASATPWGALAAVGMTYYNNLDRVSRKRKISSRDLVTLAYPTQGGMFGKQAQQSPMNLGMSGKPGR